jgi:valyl-tRNA synthetase
VLLHGMVVDETGDKMSKVKGNTLDPLDLIHGSDFKTVVERALPGAPFDEAFAKFKKAYPSVAEFAEGFPKYGTDSLRFALCSYSPQAKRIALSPKRIEGYRHFCNKIYNAVRYALTYVGGVALSGDPPKAELLVNRWILSRLARAVEQSSSSIESFRLDEGSGALYHFFWDELCDWYLELTKVTFSGADEAAKTETRQVLAHVLEASLRALHPYAPFVTEELWQRVPKPPGHPRSVALARYPTRADGRIDAAAEAEQSLLMNVIGAARTVRSEYAVHPGAAVPLLLRANSSETRGKLENQRAAIATLVKTEGEPRIEPAGGERPKGYVLSVAGDVEVLVGLKGLVEAEKERQRIARSLNKLDKDVAGLSKRLENPKFAEKAPPEVVAEVKSQLAALAEQRSRLLEAERLVQEF